MRRLLLMRGHLFYKKHWITAPIERDVVKTETDITVTRGGSSVSFFA